MNTNVARSVPQLVGSDNSRGVSPPNAAPADLFNGLTPYEYYVAECQRRYRILTDAGIEADMAFNCASWAAMNKVASKLNADDYEFCNQVYGDV